MADKYYAEVSCSFRFFYYLCYQRCWVISDVGLNIKCVYENKVKEKQG